MTHIKICGITNLADARYASGAGADYLGFIQDSNSPRYVEPSMAKDIIAWVYGAQSVGVFVDSTPDEVNAIAASAGFDLVQLHGSESPAVCAAVDAPVIKALKIWPTTSAPELELAMAAYADVVDHFLLDTGSVKAAGGTGESFDWSILESIDIPKPWFLAGGLSDDNVQSALEHAAPFGVDVSSGVEESPGRKDFELIDSFVAAVRGEVSNR